MWSFAFQGRNLPDSICSNLLQWTRNYYIRMSPIKIDKSHKQKRKRQLVYCTLSAVMEIPHWSVQQSKASCCSAALALLTQLLLVKYNGSSMRYALCGTHRITFLSFFFSTFRGSERKIGFSQWSYLLLGPRDLSVPLSWDESSPLGWSIRLLMAT